MRKKLVVKVFIIWIIISLISTGFIVSGTQENIITKCANETIIVDDEGDGNWVFIQDAIDAAGDGDIIEIYSGNYNENLVITKEITLKGISYEYGNGNDKGQPVISGNNQDDVIILNHNDIVISNLEVRNSMK